jgi:hypothetical protein
VLVGRRREPLEAAEAILLVAALPQRAAIELVLIRPTVLRDVTEDQRNVKRET